MDRNTPSCPSIRSIIIAGFAACTLVWTAIPTLSQTGGVMIPIDTMPLGDAPTDFEFARTGQGATGHWVVVEDTSAASKRAIEQSNADRTDNRFPLAIYQPT